jgi:hypothetical protein
MISSLSAPRATILSAFELCPDTSEGDQRLIVNERKPDDALFLGLKVRLPRRSSGRPPTYLRHKLLLTRARSEGGTPMANDDLHDLMNARKVLTETRLNWAKAIAEGYKRGETETVLKSLIDIQQAIEVIDIAIEELEEEELEEAEGEEDE